MQEEAGLIRVRIGSRFRNNTKYQLWVTFQVENERNENAGENQEEYCTSIVLLRVEQGPLGRVLILQVYCGT